jgi:hypothetical protein
MENPSIPLFELPFVAIEPEKTPRLKRPRLCYGNGRDIERFGACTSLSMQHHRHREVLESMRRVPHCPLPLRAAHRLPTETGQLSVLDSVAGDVVRTDSSSGNGIDRLRSVHEVVQRAMDSIAPDSQRQENSLGSGKKRMLPWLRWKRAAIAHEGPTRSILSSFVGPRTRAMVCFQIFCACIISTK